MKVQPAAGRALRAGLAAVLALGLFALPRAGRGAPLVSDERPVDDPVFGPSWFFPANAFLTQVHPAVAAGAGIYLVAWEDVRGGGYDIYAARVAADGTLLDPGGLPLTTNPFSDQDPAVAFDGTNFLVVWGGQQAGEATGWDIRGARVTPAGEILDPGGFPICRHYAAEGFPAVAFDGENYLVVWQDDRMTYVHGIFGTRVTPAGEVLDGDGVPYETVVDAVHPAVAFDGTRFLVAWQSSPVEGDDGVEAALVAPSGALLQRLTVSAGGAGPFDTFPTVAAGPDGFLVAWEGPWETSLRAARVSGAGLVLDDPAIEVRPIVTMDVVGPAAVFDGMDYLLVWSDHRTEWNHGIYAARISLAGEVLDPDSVLVADDPWQIEDAPAVAFGGPDAFVVWRDHRVSVNIYGSRVTAAGEVRDPEGVLVTAAANVQKAPAIAAGGAGFLVAWEDYRDASPLDDTPDLYAARFDAAGEKLEAGALVVSAAAASQQFPAIAWNGADWLVTWIDGRWYAEDWDLYAARVGADGSVRDPDGIPVAITLDDAYLPAVASDGRDFLVVWQDLTSRTLLAGRVAADGTPLDPDPIPLGPTYGYDTRPGVASDGSQYLVAWECPSPGDDADVCGVRVSPAGAVLDAAPFVIAAAERNQRFAVVAAGAESFLVAWEDSRSGDGSLTETRYDIYGARVAADGTVLDPDGVAITTAARSQDLPAVAFDGTNWIVVWNDRRDETPGWTAVARDVYGARVDALGHVLDPDGVPLSTLPDSEVEPAVAADGAGRALVAYHGFTPGPPGGDRVRVRLVSPAPLGASCDVAPDCDGGVCVDGVCCDDACGGGDPGDCLACSVAAGAVEDGTCAVRAPDAPCRPAAGPCDAAEVCDGSRPTCPADAFLGVETECRAVAGGCDVSERCDGSGPACPEDTTLTEGTPCRAATGPCDIAESCPGGSARCPDDVRAADGSPCPDADACDGAETCRDGECGEGAPLVCDNGDACDGVETCAPESGCVPGAAPDCDDGVDCTADRCTRAGCVHTPDPAACDDGNPCDGVESCDPAVGCVEGPAPTCDDGVACTEDGCLPWAGCTNEPVRARCDDGDACTGGEYCDRLFGCQAGTAPLCDDGVACTVDACDPAVGCTNTPDDAACDDDVPCNGAEQCLPFVGCMPGPRVDCDDGLACTVDTCDEALGCVHAPTDESCDDGDPCTADTCTVSEGCAHAPLPNDTPCPDDDVCDGAETCQGGQCTAGWPLACDDGDACNGEEACDPAFGCSAGPPLDCISADPCQIGRCDPQGGCQFDPDPACATPDARPDVAAGDDAVGSPDATAEDSSDTGVPPWRDAGPQPPDAGPPGGPDTGSTPDDLGSAPPAGGAGGSSGCSAGGPSSRGVGFLVLLGLALAGLASRRRRRTTAPLA